MRTAAIGAAGLLLVAGYLAAREYGYLPSTATATDTGADGAFSGVVDLVTDAVDVIQEGYLMPVSLNVQDQNLQAFLRMIRHCEGTVGANGYRTLFGGGTFASFADHPRQTVELSGYKTTAAGAYQFLSRTWDEVRAALSLPDFSPASQDIAAAYLIRRRGALGDVYAGRLADAVRKCGKEWASLPGSPYGQPVKTMSEVQRVYVAAGGAITGGPVYA